ncbi:MAG: ribosome assembly factor SBDS [archaeon]
MTQTTARITKQGKHYEVLVDLDEALKIKKGVGGSVNNAVLTGAIFHNLKSGEQASDDMMMIAFGTSVFEEVAEKIIKSGDIELPLDYKREELDKKYKQVVDFIVKNAVSPTGVPYTPDRIMKALHEAHVNVKNKPIDSQVEEIIDALRSILPLRIEMKKIKIHIPAGHTGKAYGIVNEYKQSEEWLSNGDLSIVVSVPAGLIMDFYDKLNGVTHGSALTEEMKK